MLTFKRTQDPPIAEVHKDGKRKKVYVSYDKSDTTRVTNLDFTEDDTTTLKFLPYIPKNQRFAAFVSGASGSGKSTVIAEMVRDLKKRNENPCYIFTAVDKVDDPAFRDLGVKHLKYKNKGVLLTLTPEMLKNTNLIFDDYNASQDEEINSFMLKLLSNILEVGRKLNINVIVVNHNTRDFHKTRTVIFECDTYVLFPATNRNAVLKFMREYADMDKAELDTIKKIDEGRYTRLYLHKSIPRFYMTSKKIQMLD